MTESKPESPADYWSRHNVTLHREFESAQESLDYLAWRNAQYIDYSDLMPTCGFEGKRILDYGCGPGNDLVGFAVESPGSKIVGCDVSGTSLAQARKRLSLHPGEVELVQISESSTKLPFPDAHFDYVHSSGVLHHLQDLDGTLGELRRVIKPDGLARIMIYHRDSVWWHLYVAWVRRILQGIDAAISMEDAFRRSTDGEDCPISRAYRWEEFDRILGAQGFEATLRGVAISLWELDLLPKRFEAMMSEKLPVDSRDFLGGITFDARGLPSVNGIGCGIDLVVEARKS